MKCVSILHVEAAREILEQVSLVPVLSIDTMISLHAAGEKRSRRVISVHKATEEGEDESDMQCSLGQV